MKSWPRGWNTTQLLVGIKINHELVGGFNPLEKYLSKWESSPSRGEKKKYLKPPPRWNTDPCWPTTGIHLGNLWNKSLTWMFLPFWEGFPYFSLPFGVTSAEVAINCLDSWQCFPLTPPSRNPPPADVQLPVALVQSYQLCLSNGQHSWRREIFFSPKNSVVLGCPRKLGSMVRINGL